MDFQLSDEQSAFQTMAKEFAEQELAPHAHEWDAKNIFPVETLRKAAELGLAGIYISSDVGGSELTRLDAAIIFEELSKACISTTAYLSIHNMVAWLIDQYGDVAQRKAWLPDLVTMQTLASYCLTEPDAGSDAASLQTQAQREGDYYVVNGTKAFISGASVSDIYACMVRTGEQGPKGISCLLIPKDTPGLSFGKVEKKLGWNSQPTSMVFFDNCKVPVANRIGEEGQGFSIGLSALNGGRINIAACSLGGAEACLQESLRYVNERKQFKQKLADFQTVQFKLADMATELEAARLMTYRGARALDTKDANLIKYCAMAKSFATEVGFAVCDNALQLHGGYGCLKEYPIERYFRDLRVHRILEGSNEIMHMIIAKSLLKENQ